MSLERLKQQAKARQRERGGTLAEAQLAIARDHDQPSWRALKAHVEAVRTVPRRMLDDAEIAAFLRAVGNGELAAVQAQLAAEPGLVNAVGPHPFWGGRPQALHVAIEGKRGELVKVLLRSGANVDGDNAEYAHWSPLMIAIDRHDAKARRWLLARGAKVRLAEALMLGDDVRALQLLRRGRAAIAGPVPNDGSWLALARTPAAIDRLLALDASLVARNRWGATPIESISRCGRSAGPLVRHLARHGIDVDAEIYARLGDRRALARIAATDPDAVLRPGVIKGAVDFGHRAVVGWLCDRGADPNARSTDRSSHDTCLHSAAWNGDLAMVEVLLARGADRALLDDDHQNTPAGWAEVAATVTNNAACLDVAALLRRAT
jgi:ankyrin repeat protein